MLILENPLEVTKTKPVLINFPLNTRETAVPSGPPKEKLFGSNYLVLQLLKSGIQMIIIVLNHQTEPKGNDVASARRFAVTVTRTN